MPKATSFHYYRIKELKSIVIFNDPLIRYISTIEYISGLLCGSFVANGVRHNDENDPSSADLGAKGNLHSRLLPERW